MYDRGMITETDLVIRLVQAVARGGVTAEVAAVVPSAILDRIREKANTPRDAKLRVIFGGTIVGGTPEEWEAFQEREVRIWREGLDRWREYFGIAG